MHIRTDGPNCMRGIPVSTWFSYLVHVSFLLAFHFFFFTAPSFFRIRVLISCSVRDT